MDPTEFQMHVDLRRSYEHIENAITQCQNARKKAGGDQFKLVVIDRLIADLKETAEPLIPILFQNHDR